MPRSREIRAKHSLARASDLGVSNSRIPHEGANSLRETVKMCAGEVDAFPRRVRSGSNEVGWRHEEVQAWMDSCQPSDAKAEAGLND